MGRFSGLAVALNTVADNLRQERAMRQETAMSQNLLGVKGLIEGNIQPSQEGTQGSFQIPGVGYVSAGGNIDKQLKQENLRYMQNVNKRMTEGGGQDLVYRDATTGIEIPSEQAISDIQSGGAEKYIISKRAVTKAGVQETPLIKPEDLTQEEKNYVITSQRLQTRLDNLLNNTLPKFKNGKFGGWQAFQAQSLPYAVVRNQDVQDFKANLNALKADIPFLRGGKQLTPTEAKRVDILLNPFGKTEQTYTKDIETFKKEFISGEQLMRKGIKALNISPQNTISEQQGEFRTTPRGNKFRVIQ